MPTVFTIGHSNRPIEEFIALLSESRIELLMDIRTVPKSRAVLFDTRPDLAACVPRTLNAGL